MPDGEVIDMRKQKDAGKVAGFYFRSDCISGVEKKNSQRLYNLAALKN
jgi:hypothetical protein